MERKAKKRAFFHLPGKFEGRYDKAEECIFLMAKNVVIEILIVTRTSVEVQGKVVR